MQHLTQLLELLEHLIQLRELTEPLTELLAEPPTELEHLKETES